MDLDDFGYVVERLTRTAEDLADRMAAGWTKVGEAFSGLVNDNAYGDRVLSDGEVKQEA